MHFPLWHKEGRVTSPTFENFIKNLAEVFSKTCFWIKWAIKFTNKEGQLNYEKKKKNKNVHKNFLEAF